VIFLNEITMFMIREPIKGMKQSAFSRWFDWLMHGEEHEVGPMIAGCLKELCRMADVSLLTDELISS